MAYCTVEDVEEETGEVFSEEKRNYIESWLETIEIVIDDMLITAGKDPILVDPKRTSKVSRLMAANAANFFQIDPSVIGYSESSGDTSESEQRVSSSKDRITRIEPLYRTLLGIKTVQIANVRTETRR